MYHVKLKIFSILIIGISLNQGGTLKMQLRKQLYTSQSGYKGLHIPKVISDELGSDLVELVWDGHSLVITPIREEA